MNRFRFIWLVGGLSLLLFLWLGGRPAEEGGSLPKKAEADARPISGAADEQRVWVEQLSRGEVSPVVPKGCSRVDVDQLDPALVLERQVVDLGQGRARRLFVINGGGVYPMHRIEEVLRYNPAQGVFEIEQQMLFVADHFLVKLMPGKTEEDLEALCRRYGVHILEKLKIPGNYIVALPECSLDGLPAMTEAFAVETDGVQQVHWNAIHAPSAIPNDTDWGALWGKQRVDCPQGWDRTTGSADVIVAVIDTGVDLDHPDLAANLWQNPGEIPDNGVDDDLNGYVDDVYGYDFGQNDSDPDDNGDEDYNGRFSAGGHGTHCAGIIGAVGNNSNQVVGVCWTVRIMVLKPFFYSSTSGRMWMYESKAEEAMVYATDHGARITSNSYGGLGYNSHYLSGIEYQNDHGVLFVAAAGNGGYDAVGDNNDVTPFYPASISLPNVIAVGSCAETETRSYFSNYGARSVDLFAPGSDILSTVSGGGTTESDGTSMAAPHVAGAAALLMSYRAQLTPLDCKAALLDSADVFSAYTGTCVSNGRLNVNKALGLAVVLNTDRDDDGLPNEWEKLYFGDETLADPSAMAANGVNTVFEAYIAGLDPTAGNARFEVSITNGYVVGWTATSGRVYSVCGAESLLDGFQPLTTNILWPQSSWTDTVERSEHFYHVDVELQK